MTIQRFEPGARMSQAVVHGGIVYLAGQVAEGATVADQTRAILANIDRLLKQAGTGKSKLLQAQIWLADIATFGEMNTVWEAWIDKKNPPARATVEARLAARQYLVEVMVTAAI